MHRSIVQSGVRNHHHRCIGWSKCLWSSLKLELAVNAARWKDVTNKFSYDDSFSSAILFEIDVYYCYLLDGLPNTVWFGRQRFHDADFNRKLVQVIFYLYVVYHWEWNSIRQATSKVVTFVLYALNILRSLHYQETARMTKYTISNTNQCMQLRFPVIST